MITVGLLTLRLYVPESRSLTDKRMILERFKTVLHRQFNVSIAEVGYQDQWQRSVVGVAGIGTDRRYVNGQLSQVVAWVERQRGVELSDYELAWW